MRCSACSHDSGPEANFCAACGARLGSAAAERRQLTLLFCDLVGSTPLLERIDAEDYLEIVDRYYGMVRRVCALRDGHVAQYVGDGVLVYFGYPRAHEDDAKLAARAGLDLLSGIQQLNRDSHDPRLQLSVRIGIHTGLVVVGDLGPRLEGVAVGDTVHTAARIESIAEPDTIWISGDTLNLIGKAFVTKDLGEHRLKGLVKPVHLHQIVGFSELDEASPRAARVPFAARELELDLLEARWNDACAGRGATVLISGEPGLGKSRLAAALRERSDDSGSDWIEIRCSRYTRNSPLSPVIRMLERTLLPGESADPAERLRQLDDAIGRLGLTAADSLSSIAGLLGVPLGDEDVSGDPDSGPKRERVFETLIEVLLARARNHPVAVLLEDLQWSDASTLELVGRLVEKVASERVLLVLTARSEFAAPWGRSESFSEIELRRLSSDVARRFVASVCNDRPLPALAIEQIVQRADGVPLFLEELARSALESKEERTGDVSVPASLRDSLMARLDRMSFAKEVALLAAPLGREFSHRLLSNVAEIEEAGLRRGIDRLVEAGLLLRQGSPPDATYTFKHVLIQDQAYQSLVKRRRKRIHGRAARALLAEHSSGVSAEPEVVARHLDAAGEVREAVAYYEKAAKQAAVVRSAHREAIRHYSRAIELLDSLPVSDDRNVESLSLHIALGVSLQAAEGFQSENVAAAYGRAQGLCNVVKDPASVAFGLYGLCAFHNARGDLAIAHQLAEELRLHGEEHDEPLYRLAGEVGLCQSAYLQGRFTSCLEYGEAGIATRDEVALQPVLAGYGQEFGVTARCFMALALHAKGYSARAVELANEAVERGRAAKHPFSLAFALVFLTILHLQRREPGEAMRAASEVIALSDRMDFPLWLGAARFITGWIEPGSADERGRGEDAIAELRAGDFQSFAPEILAMLARGRQRAGQHREAMRILDSAFALSRRTGMAFWDAELFRLKGSFLLDAEPTAVDEAERYLRLSIDTALSQEARTLELRAAVSLSRLLQGQGRIDEAREALAGVFGWFGEAFETKDLQDAAAQLQRLA